MTDEGRPKDVTDVKMFPRDGENSIYTNVLTAVNCFENKQTLNLNLKLTTLILQGGISMIRMPLSIICTWMRNILETQMMMGEISILCKCPLTYSDPHPNHPTPLRNGSPEYWIGSYTALIVGAPRLKEWFHNCRGSGGR